MNANIGKYLGTCNRQSVQCKGIATWYNWARQAYYCAECAGLINRANPEAIAEIGHQLCTEGQPTK